MTTQQPEAWENRFDENVPKTDDKLLESKQTSEDYYFGYKRMEGAEIFTVTDWGNIKSFIRTALAQERKELAEIVRQLRKKQDFYSEDQMNGHRDALDAVLAIIRNKGL